MSTIKFKSDISDNSIFDRLSKAVGDEAGEVTQVRETDGVKYYTALFPIYGAEFEVSESYVDYTDTETETSS